MTIGALVLLALACGPESGPPDRAAQLPAAAPATARAAHPDPARRIGTEGIGLARLGATLGELRAALPDGSVLGPAAPFMVDLDGLPVIVGGDTLYHVLIEAESAPGDAHPIELVATTHPAVATAEGVGPGTALGEAVARYGPAGLSYNVNDESRERAVFERHPGENVSFIVGPDPETSGFAGRYATRGEANATTSYDPAARIRLVVVARR